MIVETSRLDGEEELLVVSPGLVPHFDRVEVIEEMKHLGLGKHQPVSTRGAPKGG